MTKKNRMQRLFIESETIIKIQGKTAPEARRFVTAKNPWKGQKT